MMDSDYSGNHIKLSKILLNGNNICMVRLGWLIVFEVLDWLEQLIPGGEGPVAAAEWEMMFGKNNQSMNIAGYANGKLIHIGVKAGDHHSFFYSLDDLVASSCRTWRHSKSNGSSTYSDLSCMFCSNICHSDYGLIVAYNLCFHSHNMHRKARS